MKTKEQILQTEVDNYEESPHFMNGVYDGNDIPIYKAMEEYANQQVREELFNFYRHITDNGMRTYSDLSISKIVDGYLHDIRK